MGGFFSVVAVYLDGWFRRFFGYTQTLSFTSQSTEALIKEFCECDEVSAKNFYSQILTEIKLAVSIDDLNRFRVLLDVLNSINTYKIPEKVHDYKLHAYKLLGNINLIILACKSVAIKVLEHLCSNDNNVYNLPFLIDGNSISPENTDEDGHNAFYYAIRSNAIKCLKLLTEKWPNSYFEENSDAMDDILSNEYNELMIRRVPLSKDMELFLKKILVDLRFFQDNTAKKSIQNSTEVQDRKTLFFTRMDFVLEKIANITDQFWNKDPDEQFILEAKFIAKNLHVLKSHFSTTKFTYDKLPWEEIEFCLIIFNRACMNRFESDPLYHFVLNKKRILTHLRNFSDRLYALKEELAILNFDNIPMLQLLQRQKVIENEENAIFKDLYEDFAQVRDLYTLEAIRKNVDLALSVDATQKDGQLLIIRVLQVIGENFKNTLDSPKLTDGTAKLLFSALQSGTKDIISRLRNDLSHVEALSVRSEMEENAHSFFTDLQTDIAQMNKVLADVIRRNKAGIIKTVFNKIQRCESFDGVKEILRQNHISVLSFQKEVEESKNLNMIDMVQFEKLISHLQMETDKEISYTKEALRQTRDIIQGKHVQAYNDKNISHIIIPLLYSLQNDNSEDLPYATSEIVPFSIFYTDIRLFEKVLADIRFRSELEEIKSGLENCQWEQFPEIKKFLSQITEIENENLINVKDIEQLSKLIARLEEKIDKESEHLKEIFHTIYGIVQTEKSRLKDMQEEFSDLISFFMDVISMKKEQSSDVDLRNLIQNIKTKFSYLSQSSNLNIFMDQLYFILRSISSQMEPEISGRRTSLRNTILNIFNFVEFRMGQIKWIKEFKHVLQPDQKTKHRKPKNFDKDIEDQFTSKLALLVKIVTDNHLDELSTEKLQSCEKDPKLRSLIEMLFLDSMTTLECFPNFLAHNPFYLDAVYPIVNGKNLRNHIAHGNTLVSVFIGEEFTNVLLHVKRSIATKFNIDKIKDKKKEAQNPSGTKKKNNPNELKKSQNKNVPIHVDQEKKNIEKQTDKKAKSNSTKISQDRNSSTSTEESKDGKRINQKEKNDPILLENSQARKQSIKEQKKIKAGKQIKNCSPTSKDSAERALTSEADLEKKQIVKKIINVSSKMKEIQEYDMQIGKKIKNDPIKLKKAVEKDILHTKQQQELFTALSEGSILKVIKSIRKGADIKALDINLWASLHFAAKGPSLEVLKFVLHYNFDPNVRNASLQTALHIAAIHGRLVIVDYLIEVANTPIDDRDIDGKTPLHYACENGHLDVTKYLIKHKAKTNSKDVFGYSPMYYAIAKSHNEIANFLMEKEYSVNVIVGPCKLTALHIAAGKGCLDMINSLLKKGANVNFLSDMHIVPLHYAAKGGHFEVVKCLIEKGAKVDVESVDGLTPLHWAAETGNKEIVDILLFNGANTNATYLNSISPLAFAAKNGYSSIVKILIDNGANVKTTSFEINPIFFAAHFGHYECVKTLMHKIDNDIKTSALHEATINGHLDIVKVLAAEVSDINAVYNGTDFTVLHLAASEGQTDIIKFLIDKGCNINSKAGSDKPKRILCPGNQVFSDFINSLIDKSGKINDSTGDGQTALHLSASKGHRDTVRQLLQLKADIGIMDDFGRTPLQIMIMKDMADLLMEEKEVNVNIPNCGEFTALHLAAAKGNEEFLNHCIKKGLKVNISGTTGLTALQIAVTCNQKHIVEYLLKNGAKIDVVSDEGYTAISAAIEQNNKELLKLLIDRNAKMSAEEEREYMFTSVRNGHEDIVEYFITKNPNNVVANPVNNQYPLHVAVQNGHLNIVKKLLKELNKKEEIKKKEINLINQHFMTPLLNAVALDFCEIAHVLLSNGADPNIDTPEGFMPIHVAIMNGHTKMIEILLKFKANILVNVPPGLSTIELAIQFKNLEHVELLLQQPEVDVNAKNNSGCNLLHKAASNGCLEIIKLLINKNANANAKDIKGAKPIHYAAINGHQDIVQYFMELGMMINEKGGKNWSLLHYAAAGNHSEICDFLLKNGLDVNVTDIQGNTALHVAAEMGHIDVIHLLLQNESHYDIRNQSNKTPLDVTDWENLRIKTSLTLIQNLFTAVQKNELKKTEILLNKGITFSEFGYANIKNSINIALIHYAAMLGYEEIVNILLKYKANVNITNENGGTALHYACEFSHYRIVKILLLNGAAFEAQCKIKKTPVECATNESIINFLKFVKEMFDRTQNCDICILEDLKEIEDLDTAKAVLRAKDNDGRNLASFAIVNNHPKAEQLKELFQTDTIIPIKMALIFYVQGQYQESLKQYNTVLKKRIDLFGEDNPGVWDIQFKMSAIHIYLNNYDEALGLAEHVYEKRKQMLGRFRKETLAAKTQLALILGYKGKKQQAVNILEEISNMQKDILGLCHIETLTTLTYMTQLLFDINNLEKGLEVCEEILSALNVYSKTCWWVWNIENTKGNILSKQGKHKEAMKIFVKCYEMKKRMHEFFHSDLSLTLYNIAVLFLLMGQEDESLENFQKVLELQMQNLCPEHPDILQTRHCIANILFAQRRFYEALKIYEGDFKLRKIILGEDNPEIIQTLQRINFINFKLKSHFFDIDLKWKFKTSTVLH